MLRILFLALFYFLLITFNVFSQEDPNQYTGFWIQYACDSCAYNHNPLAYAGGNIKSASIIKTTDGKCLKLTSTSIIDTNAVPAYFEMYTLSSNTTTCNSLRKEGIVIDNSNFGKIMFKINPNNSGFRVWLAATSSLSVPKAGESTFQLDAQNSDSLYVLQATPFNSTMTILFDLYEYKNSPIFNWELRKKINMVGFTALKPNTEYYIWEIGIGDYNYIPFKLAGYDCGTLNAVIDEAFKDKIQIYPVPTSENLIIEIPNYDREYYVEVISSEGEVLHHNFYSGKTHLKMNGYNKGMYLVKVTMGDSYYTKKILKE